MIIAISNFSIAYIPTHNFKLDSKLFWSKQQKIYYFKLYFLVAFVSPHIVLRLGE